MAGTLRMLAKAEILNISLTGMAARTSSHLRVGQICDVRLEHGTRTLRLPARVVRAQLVSFGKTSPGETAPTYEIGFEFQDMLSEGARELLDFFAGAAVVSVSTRTAGRFKVRDRTAGLDASAELVVTEISTRGVRVETTLEPELDQEVELGLELGQAALHCRGRVASVEARSSSETPAEDEAPAPVKVGIEFVDLGPEEIHPISEFIAGHLD